MEPGANLEEEQLLLFYHIAERQQEIPEPNATEESLPIPAKNS